MKSITATLSILLFFYLGSQVSLADDFDLRLDHQHEPVKEFQSNSIRRALAALKFGLQTLRREKTTIKLAVHLENLGFIKANTKTCNFTDIEYNFANFVGVTVDFASDAATYLEAISDLVNNCASTSFPKSISCFLNLAKNCQPDIDAIEQALQEFKPKAQSLFSSLLLDIANCYHW